MLNNLKALVVVLGLSFVVFRFAKPICLLYMTEENFVRRRNVWYMLTVAVFASPSFWTYAAVAIPTLLWVSRKDSNPLAMYMLALYAAPNYGFYIPVVGVNQLFELSHHRILALCVLLTVLFAKRGREDSGRRRGAAGVDFLIVSYCLLQVVLRLPYESATAGMRRMFLLFLDILLPYLAFSRGFRNWKAINEAVAMFVLGCAILVPIAVFEAARTWLLYVGVGSTWGAYDPFAFLMRAGSLRAQVSTGHSLALGFAMAIAFLFWLYLQRRVESKYWSIGGALWMWLGSFAAYSRGPWIVAMIFMFMYFLLLPRGISRAIKSLFALGAVGAMAAMTPFGQRIIQSLPFIGNVDSDNVTYRQRLLETALDLIPQNPWFGDPFVMSKMEHLRQGQGIIDIVNGYVGTALFFGLVGLFLMVGFFLASMGKAYAASVRMRPVDENASALGSNIVAFQVGALVFLGIAGFELLMWVMAGVAVAYANVIADELDRQVVSARAAARVKQPRNVEGLPVRRI